MRALREKMKEAAKQDNRGLSLVEVLCAIAIFSMIAAAIGTVVVLSARTFNRGVTETSLQQEAQLVANRIGTIVQDACEASFDEGAKTLTLKTNDNKTYTISLSGQELVYSDDTMSGAKLAEKIQSFSVKTDDFDKSNTVYLDMRVADGNKVYNVQYAIAARNQMTADIPNTPLAEHVSIFSDSEVVMVPGETYKIPYSVNGKINIGMDAAITSGTATIGAVGLDGVEVTIPTSTTDTVVQLQVFTKDTIDGTTTPKATANINIRIRRVNSISVTHNSDRSAVDPGKSGNSYEAQGCVYTFYARVSADNPEKQAGTTYDSGWKNPKFVYWSDKATLNGTPVNVTDYFDVVYSTDLNIPTAKYTIKEDLPSGLELTVRATSKHAKGENKASSDYYVDTKGVHWNEDSIKARETKVTDKLEITIEPNHSGEVELGMKGGKTSDISFVYNNRSDATTKAEYNASTDKVKITLGNDEKGVGKNPAEGEKFTFTIDVLVKGTKKSTITVHVRRIDNISIEVIDNFYDASGNLMGNPTYDFRTRINVDNNKNDANMQKAIKYLFLDKESDTKTLSANVSKTLASRISWEMKNTKTGTVIQSDSVICLAGTSASDKGQVIGTYKKEVTGYYTIINVKPARVEQDADGNWYLKQVPEIDVKPAKGTSLPAGTEFTVKIEMLHPLGGEYNETGIAYGKAEATASVMGEQSVSVPELIVAEPGQGTSDPAQSDYELAIPIEVSGGDVYRMTAEISGNSSKDTKLSAYEQEDENGNKNPYKAENAGSGSSSIWYLGLLIGTDEKGSNNSGLMDLTVTAYDAQGEQVAKVESKIAIRRVTKVKIDGTAKAADVSGAVITQDEKGNRYLNYDYNKKGSTITLEAYATGYGSDGTEYFGIQKDEKGNTLRWEKDGHGKYQTPYSMKWSIYDKKGNALNLSDYFESVPTLVDIPENGVTKSTITFTLKKALPNGTRIKATSLHAMGKNDGVKTNKSGKEYDDVYDLLKIDIIDPDDPVDDSDIDFLDNMQRGQDFDKFPDMEKEKNSFYASNVGGEAKWFWRIREILDVKEDGTVVYGPWTEYRRTLEGSMYKKLNAMETRSLLPDKRYQIQMAFMKIDKDSRTVYWPYDSSLVAAGSGTGFEGYNKGWSSDKQRTPEEVYSTTYNIGRSCYVFKKDGVMYKSYGSVDNPVVLHNGEDYQIDLDGYTIHQGHFQHMSVGRVQKLESNTWKSLGYENGDRHIVGHGICENIQDKSSFILIKNVYGSAKGIYRLSFKIHIDDQDVTKWTGTDLWNPSYATTEDLKGSEYLVCGSNGTAGYLYIRIE